MPGKGAWRRHLCRKEKASEAKNFDSVAGAPTNLLESYTFLASRLQCLSLFCLSAGLPTSGWKHVGSSLRLGFTCRSFVAETSHIHSSDCQENIVSFQPMQLALLLGIVTLMLLLNQAHQGKFVVETRKAHHVNGPSTVDTSSETLPFA